MSDSTPQDQSPAEPVVSVPDETEASDQPVEVTPDAAPEVDQVNDDAPGVDAVPSEEDDE